MKTLIQRLVDTPGPSGYESQMRDLIRSEVEPLTSDVRVDNLGNLIACIGSGDFRVMLAAHMDEIGLIATHVDENGFVRFLPVGVVFPITCIGGRVRFLNGARGVIGIERPDDGNRVPGFDQMYIDLGVDCHEKCPVRVGDVATFERSFSDLGKRLVAKSLDDRVGVALLIETLRNLAKDSAELPQQVFLVFSVQEEVGIRGAAAAAFGLDPHLGLAVDVTSSGDTPHGLRMEVSLGKGPAIKVRDQGMVADPRVVNWMVNTAEKAGLPYQLEILERGTTDARAIQLTRAGIPAGSLSIPCRYIHSPSEMVDYDDLQNSLSLLVELLRHPIALGSWA